jgi:hypothetical protein
MSNTKTVMSQAANTQGIPLDITDVFSTYLYSGDATTRDIVNNIDLAGEGGLVWIKTRNAANGHFLFDTERGVQKYLQSDTTGAEGTLTNALSAFNSDGFEVKIGQNNTGDDQVSWTFRKAPKFFDVVTYTGTGSSTRDVSHNLGVKPGVIIIKRTDTASDWVYTSRVDSGSYYLGGVTLNLNTTAAYNEGSGGTLDNGLVDYNNTTDSTFRVADGFNVNDVNASGATYVAYLFAHNDGDGEFGPDADQDIIKCGSYTDNGSTNVIDLGFEPQWILFKRSSSTGGWHLFDTMRGLTTGADQVLYANLSNAEGTASGGYLTPTATGFTYPSGGLSVSGDTLIYIAIRRGPLAPPESATEVFAIATRDATAPAFNSGFPVDTALFVSNITGSSNREIASRLTGAVNLEAHSTDAEQPSSQNTFDYMDGYSGTVGTLSTRYSWMWKRAPSFFDVVAYTGDGTSARDIYHNLTVTPELMINLRRNPAGSYGHIVWHKDLSGKNLFLNVTQSTSYGPTNRLGNPTSTTFHVDSDSDVNGAGNPYITYLFASLPGISKVGSYTGSNSVAVEVDCGFTSGARFVLIKRTDATGDWYIYDSVRGIVSNADDPYLLLNTTDAEAANTNNIEPLSSGFKLTVQGSNPISINGGSYIFYAIA